METRVRSTARALLVTPEREVLLVRFAVPAIGRHFWITPGGGIEPGETEREAAAREVAEETGLAGAAIGPAVWTRSVSIPWAEPPFTQRETYFWVPTQRFGPGDDFAGVLDDALALCERRRREHARAVNVRSSYLDAPRALFRRKGRGVGGDTGLRHR